jgi:hypothetical protein
MWNSIKKLFATDANNNVLGFKGPGGVSFRTSEIWVSSTGNDENSGTSAAAAVSTLARAVALVATIGDGARIYLNAGGTWRESLDLVDYDGVTVEGYGDFSAGLPIVRGDDIVTGAWLTSTDRADANTNVYSHAWLAPDLSLNQAGIPPHVYCDDVLLTWVANVATCQSTAGSFYHTGSTSNPNSVTLYVHPAGDTNPNSDGKIYSASKRDWAVRVGNGGTVRYIHGMNAGHDNGSINGADDCLVERCLMRGSPIHEGLMSSGIFRESIAWHPFDDARTGAILLEFYRSNGSGYSGVWDKCIAVGPTGGSADVSGFGGHVASGNDATVYRDMLLKDSLAHNCDINFDDAKTVTGLRIKIFEGQFRLLSSHSAGYAYWTDIYAVASGSRAAGPFAASGLPACNVVVDGLRVYVTGVMTYGIILNPERMTCKNSVFVLNARSGTTPCIRAVNSDQVAVAFSNCMFYNLGAGTLRAYDTANCPIVPTSDYNVYSSPAGAIDWRIYAGGSSTIYSTLATLQAGTTMDDNSTESDAVIVVSPASADWMIANIEANRVGLRRDVEYLVAPTSIAECIDWIIKR